jgi:uncharacterized protein (TIGR02598 family)
MKKSSHLSLHRGRTNGRAGFSLVEVVMAVAIAALGIITLLGLIPHGLSTSRKTINEIATTRIVAQLIAEIQLADWNTLQVNSTNQSRLFDDQGVEITKSSDDSLISYVARLTLPSPDVALPRNNGTGYESNIRRVIVDVAPVPVKNFFSNNPAPGSYRTFTQLVSKLR